MVRKISAIKKRAPERESFFEQIEQPKMDAMDSSNDRLARIEHQLQLLRQECFRLREENERLTEAARLAPYGYCEIDHRGLILAANETAVRMLGSDVPSVQGIAFVSFLPERFHQKFLSFLHHSFQTQISDTIRIPVTTPIDDEYELQLDCRSLSRPQGRVACCVMRAPTVVDPNDAFSHHEHDGHFKTIAEYSADWKMWIGSDGVLVWVSKGVELLTGYLPQECYAIPDFPYPLIAPTDRDRIAEIVAEGLAGREDSDCEFRYLRKDGTEVWGMLDYHPMYDHAGQSLGFCATVRSVEERKNLEEELVCATRVLEDKVQQRTLLLQKKNAALRDRVSTLTDALAETRTGAGVAEDEFGAKPEGPTAKRSAKQEHLPRISKKVFEQVLNALGDPVLVKDKDHRIVLVNNSFIDFTGFNRDTVIGKKNEELYPADEADLFTASDNAVLEKQGEFQVEEFFTRYDGQQRRVLVKKDIFFDENGDPFIVAVLRDVTELRVVEEEVRTALVKEKELNELKTRFVTMVSHEYKTPLTAILSSAELLELFRKTWSDEKVNLHLQKIKRAVETMTEMLSDALFLNKIETGRVQISSNTFELVSFCIMIADEFQAYSMHQNTIDTSSSVTHAQVCTDNKLLRYILTNLLSNAVKYSFPGTSIQFETVLTEQTVTFRVRNRGIGIPPETSGNLFEPFFRAPNTGTIQGSGLGLSIVKRCVDSLGGTIGFESVMNDVTTFSVTIPIEVIEYQTGIARGVPKSLATL